jgi:hypothetical protein
MYAMENTDLSDTLLIGWAARDVTPDRPVMLRGQFHVRIAETVHDPLTVTALALETAADQCVMVSADHVTVPAPYIEGVRKRLRGRIPGLDPDKVFISATHTHTAPQMLGPEDRESAISWEDPGPGVMRPEEYGELLIERTADCVAEAWRQRSPGRLAWSLGHAVVGRNRRQVKRDGTALMYGDTATPDFSHIEGYEDHSVQFLFTWDAADNLTGALINLACPSQVTESHTFVSADFWHETRHSLRELYGDALHILPQCAPAGDQSPHLMFDQKAEARMLRLRGLPAEGGDLRLAERAEIARRLTTAFEEALPPAAADKRGTLALAHAVRTVELPRRHISEDDVREAEAQMAFYAKRLETELADRPAADRERSFCYGRRSWYSRVLTRYELQKTRPLFPVEIHVVRLGDAVFATNPFELYLDFGIRMRTRSPAEQTFLVQLAGAGTYLPSARAVAGKSYGSEPASNEVGPEGGDILVEETLRAITDLFA